MKKTQRNQFKKQERLKKRKLRKRGKQTLLQKFLKQQREFPMNKVGLIFSTMIISKKSTASFTHSSPPKQAPVHVNEAQRKPQTITSNTGTASPPSSILILGEPVLNSGKTSSHDHAKKKAKRTTTGIAENLSSSNSPMDGKVEIPQETPTQRGAKKKAKKLTYSGTGDRSTRKVLARHLTHITPVVISDMTKS